jgi:hypothetical protein
MRKPTAHEYPHPVHFEVPEHPFSELDAQTAPPFQAWLAAVFQQVVRSDREPPSAANEFEGRDRAGPADQVSATGSDEASIVGTSSAPADRGAEPTRSVALNFERVTFLGAAGVTELVRFEQMLHSRGWDLKLQRVGTGPARTLGATGFLERWTRSDSPAPQDSVPYRRS